MNLESQTPHLKKKCVYINPNFKNSHIGEILPSNSESYVTRTFIHINPSFKSHNGQFEKGELVDEKVNIRQNRIPAVPKIHLNPKVLTNIDKIQTESNKNIHTVVDVHPKNKFLKINPKITKVTSDDSLRQLCRSSAPFIRPKKPCRVLIRYNSSTKNGKPPSPKKVENTKNYPVNIAAATKIESSEIKRKQNVPKFINSASVSDSVFVAGQKFWICDDKLKRVGGKTDCRAFSRIVRRIRIGGKIFVRRSSDLFVVENGGKPSRKRLKKNNTPCPVYGRKGICAGLENGKCPLLHDPKRIAVCKKFLRGDCRTDGCRLSHEVAVGKLPTCKYFLEGCCSKTSCPYPHVKINDDAEACSAFLRGFCEAGENCDKLHLHVLNETEKSKRSNPAKKFPREKPPQPEVDPSKETRSDRPETSTRYYDDSTEESGPTGAVGFKHRPKIGKLPSYIAI